YALNFDPQFDAAYEPENWKLAVNNESFRQAIFQGLDRVKAIMTLEPNNPSALLINTITPPEFVNLNGVDYTQMGGLQKITVRDSFQPEQAKASAQKAKAELTAAGAVFPVKVLLTYNPTTTDWDKECQVVEQQLEALLGSDFIDVIPEAGPSSGFLKEVRRAGKYALMKCNWGPDYADPATYTDPFVSGGSYNFPEKCVGYEEADGTKTYDAMVAAAKEIRMDDAARYAAFAEAETFLIEHAFVIPFSAGGNGYLASKLDPFTSQYSPFGVSSERYKGQQVLEKPMSTEDYFAAYEAWTAERAQLSQAAQ
ncbi:MAG: ABC transporter substrate-binding protein, partial [Clostridia bacterium]